MLGTYVNVELANPLTKCTLLVIWQIQDVFNTSRTTFHVQELSEEVLYVKAWQLV